MLDHERPLHAKAEGKALPFLWVDPHVLSTFGCTMPQPPISSHLPSRLSSKAPCHIMSISSPGLTKEEPRAEAKFHLLSDEFRERRDEHRFQVRKRHILSYHQSFKLMEHGRVCCIGVLAVDLAGTDHPKRRLAIQHVADLHGGRVRPGAPACRRFPSVHDPCAH